MTYSGQLSLGVIATALAVIAAGCTGGQAQSAQQGRAGAGAARGGAGGPVPVTTAPVVQKSMPIQIKVIGTAEAYSSVAIRSQITGQLTSVNFKEGDDVRQGQVLFTLDRRPLEATLQQSQATLDKDLAQAANAKAIARRQEDLAARGIATREALETARTTAAALEATVGADRAAVQSAQVQLQYATIAAPISGRTGALMVHEGNLVRANDTQSLVVINQVTPINVVFGIPEARLPEFKRFMAQGTLHVEAAPPTDEAPPSIGRIGFVDNNVDPSTGTIKLKGTFPNQDRRLWPGQFVNVIVTLTSDPAAIVVPAVAVQTGQQGQYVFVVKPDQTVDLRNVQVARTSGEEAVVAQGLKPGETVVTDGQLRLVPGSRVTVKGAAGRATS